MQTNAHCEKSRDNKKEKQKTKTHMFNPRSRNSKRPPPHSKDRLSNKDKKRKLTNNDDCPIYGAKNGGSVTRISTATTSSCLICDIN